jgi:antitoxin CptB
MEHAHYNRLKWSCRRGMLELDLVLINYLENHFPLLSVQQQNNFEQLLSCTDPELENWLLRNQSPDKFFIDIVNDVRHKLKLP